ncbi:hypothetical protein OAM04_01570 [bacterium]|nr:hypothetical protein [Verrucomicrobiales bacterium]MDC0311890.1 hypothetical protein [bacterium]
MADSIITLGIFESDDGPCWIVAESSVDDLAELEDLGADAIEENNTLESFPSEDEDQAFNFAMSAAKEQKKTLYRFIILADDDEIEEIADFSNA